MECFVIGFENLESVAVAACNSFDSHLLTGWASFVSKSIDSDPDKNWETIRYFIYFCAI